MDNPPVINTTHQMDQPPVINTTDSPLDLEHESCLKQQLLRHAVQSEVDIFMENPAYVHDSLYLDFIYQQVRDVPLLNCHDKAKEKLEELVLNLPHFLTVSQRASKHDQQNRKLRVFVAGTFHLNFRTPLERQEDRKLLLQVYSSGSTTICYTKIHVSYSSLNILTIVYRTKKMSPKKMMLIQQTVLGGQILRKHRMSSQGQLKAYSLNWHRTGE